MMNSWNSVIFMRSKKSPKEIAAMAMWDEVDKMWSTSGNWDWCVKLKPKNSSPEMTESVDKSTSSATPKIKRAIKLKESGL